MTIKQLAREALLVQDACNLTGVVNGMGRALANLRELGEYRTNHPVAVLWADKVAHLTGTQVLASGKTDAAYKWAYEVTSDGAGHQCRDRQDGIG